jgi:hypothetical protein
MPPAKKAYPSWAKTEREDRVRKKTIKETRAGLVEAAAIRQ